jgi:hypothetical protein
MNVDVRAHAELDSAANKVRLDSVQIIDLSAVRYRQ